MTYALPILVPQWTVAGKMAEDLFLVPGEQPRAKHWNAWRTAVSAFQTESNNQMRRSALGKRFDWRDMTLMTETGTGLEPEIVPVPTLEDEQAVLFKGDVAGETGQVEEVFLSGPVALKDGLVELFFRTPATTGKVVLGATLTPLIEGVLEGTPVSNTEIVNVSATAYGWQRVEIPFLAVAPTEGLWAKVRIYRDRWSVDDSAADVPEPVYVVAGAVL